MFRIKDLQIEGRYFADGESFETKEDVRKQLIDYHSTDMEDDDIVKLEDMTLDEILAFGQWSIEVV